MGVHTWNDDIDMTPGKPYRNASGAEKEVKNEKMNETYLSKLLKSAEERTNLYPWAGKLTIEINPQRGCRESVQEYLSTTDCGDGKEEECILINELVVINFYPCTPTGFIRKFGTDVETVAKMVLEDLRDFFDKEYLERDRMRNKAVSVLSHLRRMSEVHGAFHIVEQAKEIVNYLSNIKAKK